MIFVTVGSTAFPFDRLMRAVMKLDAGEPIVVQYGRSTTRPPNATCIDYLPFDAFVETVRAARVVVAHAGAGSVLTTIMQGRRPIVVPRLPRFGEVTDGHQYEFAVRLDRAGLVTLVEDPERLGAVIARGAQPLAPIAYDSLLVDEIASYVRDVTSRSERGRTARRPRSRIPG